MRGTQHQRAPARFGQGVRGRAIGDQARIGQNLPAGNRQSAVCPQGDASVSAQGEGFAGRQAAAVQHQFSGSRSDRGQAQIAIARNLQAATRHGGYTGVTVRTRQRERARALFGQTTGAADHNRQRHII